MPYAILSHDVQRFHSAVVSRFGQSGLFDRGSTHDGHIIFALRDNQTIHFIMCARSRKRRPFTRIFVHHHRVTEVMILGDNLIPLQQSRQHSLSFCVHSKLSRYRGTTPSLPTYLRRRAYIGYDDGTIRWFRVDRNLDLFVFDLANDVDYRSLSAHTPPRSSYLSTLPGRIQCIAFEKGIDLLG